MSIFKLLISITKESSAIATRATRETSAHMHKVTERKLSHLDHYLKERNSGLRPEHIDTQELQQAQEG